MQVSHPLSGQSVVTSGDSDLDRAEPRVPCNPVPRGSFHHSAPSSRAALLRFAHEDILMQELEK